MLKSIGEVAIFLVVTTVFVAPYIRLFKVKSAAYEPSKKIEYTKQLLDFTKEFIGEQCVIKFNLWLGEHKMDLTTKAQFTSYIAEVVREIRSSIQSKNISFDNTFITEDYFDTFVINSTIIFMKNLFEAEYKKFQEGEIYNG